MCTRQVLLVRINKALTILTVPFSLVFVCYTISEQWSFTPYILTAIKLSTNVVLYYNAGTTFIQKGLLLSASSSQLWRHMPCKNKTSHCLYEIESAYFHWKLNAQFLPSLQEFLSAKLIFSQTFLVGTSKTLHKPAQLFLC